MGMVIAGMIALGNGQRGMNLGAESHVDEHVGTQHIPRIGNIHPQLQGAGVRVELRRHGTHPGGESAALIRHAQVRNGGKEAGIVFKNVAQHPDRSQVGNPVQFEALIEALARRQIPGQHQAFHGRGNSDR